AISRPRRLAKLIGRMVVSWLTSQFRTGRSSRKLAMRLDGKREPDYHVERADAPQPGGGIFRPPRSCWSGGSFPPCLSVSPTSTVRTIWRAGPGRWSEPKATTGVAIVIPMLNEAAGLPRLLRSLAALEPPPAEVLAVDG